MKKFVILFAAMTFAVACGNNAEADTKSVDNVEALKKEVMEVHDKTMEQMGTLSKLDKALNSKFMQQGGDTATYMNVITDLRRAHEDMMDWMRNFENPDEMQASEEEKVDYLKGQKEKLNQLEEYTTSSIERGQKLLEGN